MAGMPPPPPAALVQHAAAAANGLFSNIFRINLLTQQLNQQLWDEERLLTRSIQQRKHHIRQQQHWMWDYFPTLTVEDDEKLLHLISAQIQTNNHVIEWCQGKMQNHLVLTANQRQALDQMLRRNTRSWKSLIKDQLSTLLTYGGLAALMYVADYYFNGSTAFNAVMSALGLHKYKLQQLLPQRALDWIKTKLHLHPRSLVDKMWLTMMRVVRQKSPSLLCRKLGLCAGGTVKLEQGAWLAFAHPGSESDKTRPASSARSRSTDGPH